MPIISLPQKNVIFGPRADGGERRWNRKQREPSVEIKPLNIGVVWRFVPQYRFLYDRHNEDHARY